MEIVLSPIIQFNFDNAEELKEKTGFNLAGALTNIWYECRYTHFTVNDVPFEIRLPTLMSASDCRIGGFSVFVEADEQLVSELFSSSDDSFISNIKEQIVNAVCRFVDELNEKANIVVPTDNFDNIIYNEDDEQFYIKLGETSPLLVKLKFEIDRDDIGPRWSRDIR